MYLVSYKSEALFQEIIQQALNSKPNRKPPVKNHETSNEKYNMEDCSLEFAKRVKRFVRKLKLDVVNIEGRKQLVRSSRSVGANYIEANDGLSKKDFLFRIKISQRN